VRRLDGNCPQERSQQEDSKLRNLIGRLSKTLESIDTFAQSHMDDVDQQLLSLLREDARASVASLAKSLRVARGTVQNRIAKLEANGTIVGYTVRLKPQTEANRIVALMTIAVEGNAADAVIRALRGDPAVQTLHTTNGRWDIVAELRADTLEAFDRVLSRIRLIEGIAHTETSLLLSTHKL
jgi:DNA-binding Lrp family transcriptional regulator